MKQPCGVPLPQPWQQQIGQSLELWGMNRRKIEGRDNLHFSFHRDRREQRLVETEAGESLWS